MPVKSHIADPSTGKLAEVSGNLDGTNRLHVDAMLDVEGQAALPVTFAVAGDASLPQMLTLYRDVSLGAVVNNVYLRFLTYTVPAGYSGYLVRFSSYQSEAARSRVVAELNMGTLSIVTNVFVGGSLTYSYVVPQWSSLIQAEVTTGLSAGAGNITVTIDYTNELGVSSRTGTFTIPKGSLVGSRWDLTLAVGDLGVRSIQSMSVSPTLAAGVIKMLGLIQLGYHEDGGTLALETMYSPGVTSFLSGTVLGLEFAGGTVSKTRRVDLLLQLVPEV